MSFEFSDCVAVPMDPNSVANLSMNRTDNKTTDEDIQFPFPECVGTIFYVSQVTRPDLYFGERTLSTYTNSTELKHVNAVKQALRYLQGTKTPNL